MAKYTELKVLLVNPPVLEVHEPWFDLPDFGRVGLAYVAGYLRHYADFNVKVEILDSKFLRLDFEETFKRIIDFAPHVLGFTAFTNEIKPAAYLAYKVKQALPDTLMVVGGAHVTAIPEPTLREFPSFDVGAVGEGEQTFLDICRQYYLGGDMDGVKGIVYKKDGGLKLNQVRERILDQDSIPFPAWDLMPAADTYYIQTVRGCPFSCVFCMNHNGKVARKRSVENVVEEIQLLITKYKPKRISFGDELFSVDMKRTGELMDAMVAAGIPGKVTWDAQTHVRFVDYELFAKMKKAGVTRIEMGVETGDEVSLKNMGKATSVNMILDAFKAAKKAGVHTGSFLLFGQPNETVETIQSTINLAVKVNADLPMFGLMTPYPATEVARLAAKGEGGYTIVSLDWDNYRKQIGGAMEFANLTRRQIEFYQVWGYLKVFLWNFRFKDLLSFLWEYRMGVLGVFKKTFLRIKESHSHSQKPSDYELVLSKGSGFDTQTFIDSADDWKNYQRNEQARANKHAKTLQG